MKFDANLERELGVERDRWSCPKYNGAIFTSESKWLSVVAYVQRWDNTSYDESRMLLRLGGGGSIKFYTLQDRDNEDLKASIAGLEITTSIIDTSVVHELNCNMRDFPLFAMSRMRSECKHDCRLVII
ncbi:hypothetical protein NVP1121O_004 [Vibrio phage 1.121.O._10N.286.46.C4]|nr:hypothetical protein NVP1121O_004 [Vibrio phage 1.121.O._10N.286.46.C4]